MNNNFFVFDTINTSEKLNAFHQIADVVSKYFSIPTRQIVSSMLTREKIASTALAEGIALPHIILDINFDPMIFVFIDKTPILNWKDETNQNIKVLICYTLPNYIQPKDTNVYKLKSFSIRLSDDDFIEKIGNCNDIRELEKVILS